MMTYKEKNVEQLFGDFFLVDSSEKQGMIKRIQSLTIDEKTFFLRLFVSNVNYSKLILCHLGLIAKEIGKDKEFRTFMLKRLGYNTHQSSSQ